MRYLTLVVSLALAAPLHAQDTTQAKLDSLRARLALIEERLGILQQQSADDAANAVRTRSRLGLELHGQVLMGAFHNSARVNNTDVPTFVRPTDPTGTGRGLGMSVRQTSLGAALTVREVLGGTFIGDLDVDFFGGQQPSSGGRTFPLLRLRTARATLAWSQAELMVGQESPLIAGVNPVTVAAVGIPGFTSAGNLWLWIPQLRATVQTKGAVRLGLQGAVLAPGTGDAVPAFDVPDFDAGERSERPMLQSRVRLQWGEDDRLGELGVGVHRGWFDTAADTLATSTAVAADIVLPLTNWLELRGEFHDGSGTRTMGGGAIGQLFGVGGRPVRNRAAWGQLNLQPTPGVTIGGGYGMDDPRDNDIVDAGRLKNTATQAHLIWRPAGPMIVGVEYRRLETSYRSGAFTNDHVHLTFGFEF